MHGNGEAFSPKPIAVNLHSLHADAERDFGATLERVAAIGFAGVEAAGLHGMSPDEFRQRVDALGLTVTSAQLLSDDLDAELEEQRAIGNTRLIADFGPECFTSMELIAKTADEFNDLAAQVRDGGMTLGYHNHWWEYTPTDATPHPMAELVKRLDPEIFLEIDTYYVATAWHETNANDPVEALGEVADRVRLLHVKDGPCTLATPSSANAVDMAGKLLDPSTAVGDGKADIKGMLTATPRAEWHIVEVDNGLPNVFDLLEASHRYLIGAGLSHGRGN